MQKIVIVILLSASLLTVFSCERENTLEPIKLEYSSDLNWLEEQGYIRIDETHKDYNYLVSLLAKDDGETNQAVHRANYCAWEGRPRFGCDSGSGGECNMYASWENGVLISACVVCEGGTDDGASDCLE